MCLKKDITSKKKVIKVIECIEHNVRNCDKVEDKLENNCKYWQNKNWL